MFKQCQQHLCRFSLSSLPRSPGAFPFSRSRFLFSSFLPFPSSHPSALFTWYSSLFLFKPSSHLLPTLIFVSVPLRTVPSALSFSHSLLFSLSLSLSASLLGWCICVTTIMSSSYTRRCATYKLTWFVLGKMVVFEYNMYLVYPTG